MEIHLVAKDELEAQGIRWMVESHFTGVKLVLRRSIEEFEKGLQWQQPELVILDMDGWKKESEKFGVLLQQYNVHWLGISSERIFQTAYRALRFRAEDVLFRPFAPSDLIKHIQQIRYQLHNEQRKITSGSRGDNGTFAIDYPDLFLSEKRHANPVTMVAFLTPNNETLPFVYNALQRFSFTGKNNLFALSDFILCVLETDESNVIREECHGFLARWKEMMDEPVAIVVKTGSEEDSLKKVYQQTRQLTRRVFFEGYDIILAENEQLPPREMDPFLTPLEQRQWMEMLAKGDIKAIRDWVEHEFLTYEQPYPDPEIVRIRITSVLAQIRRHMKSYSLKNTTLEASYHEVFQQIVHNPVIYKIVQELLAFTTRLLSHGKKQIQDGPTTLVEKVKELMESNYWDAGWNLAECADSIRINKSTLSRRFAAESGQSFRRTLHLVRIREAKRLLRESNLSLEEIARLTGYSHQTYFNAKFKQYEGTTPSAYRSGL